MLERPWNFASIRRTVLPGNHAPRKPLNLRIKPEDRAPVDRAATPPARTVRHSYRAHSGPEPKRRCSIRPSSCSTKGCCDPFVPVSMQRQRPGRPAAPALGGRRSRCVCARGAGSGAMRRFGSSTQLDENGHCIVPRARHLSRDTLDCALAHLAAGLAVAAKN